jgi:hypothetical protein
MRTRASASTGKRRSTHEQRLEGRGTGAPVAVTAPRAFVHRYHGNVIAAADPAGSTLNNRYTGVTHAGINSYTPALLNALWNGGSGSCYGPNDSVIMCGVGMGGTTTAYWATSAGSAPPLANGCFGVWELRLRDLIRNLPNPQVLALVGDIGESDGATTITAPGWPTGMTTVYQAMLSMLAAPWPTGLGLTFAKALRMVLRILPDLAATGFSGWSPPATPNVQTLQLAWAAAENVSRPNSVVTYKPTAAAFPVGYVAADNLHFSTPALATIGTAIGDLIRISP